MFIHTLHQSLSFDRILKAHATRIDAENYMARVLRVAGGRRRRRRLQQLTTLAYC